MAALASFILHYLLLLDAYYHEKLLINFCLKLYVWNLLLGRTVCAILPYNCVM